MTPSPNQLTPKAALEAIRTSMVVWRNGDIKPEALLRYIESACEEALKAMGQDLNKCPNCGGEADNGHDRCVPPNPYYCTKCTQEVRKDSSLHTPQPASGEQPSAALTIGEYTIHVANDYAGVPTVFIEKPDGEGGGFDIVKFEQAIKEFYDRHF